MSLQQTSCHVEDTKNNSSSVSCDWKSKKNLLPCCDPRILLFLFFAEFSKEFSRDSRWLPSDDSLGTPYELAPNRCGQFSFRSCIQHEIRKGSTIFELVERDSKGHLLPEIRTTSRLEFELHLLSTLGPTL
jgi:hypothetical protein